MTMKPHKPTVAVLYGFCEGGHLAGKLKQTLADAGFAYTNDVSGADVIIAHSGGCWLVPTDAQAQRIILVGVSIWPHKPLAIRMVQKIRQDFSAARAEHRLASWCTKTFWNGFYFWNMPRNVRMLRAFPHNPTTHLHAKHIVCIRNAHDAFCSPDIAAILANPNVCYVSLPGEHDDIWQNPKAYVDIAASLRTNV